MAVNVLGRDLRGSAVCGLWAPSFALAVHPVAGQSDAPLVALAGSPEAVTA